MVPVGLTCRISGKGMKGWERGGEGSRGMGGREIARDTESHRGTRKFALCWGCIACAELIGSVDRGECVGGGFYTRRKLGV